MHSVIDKAAVIEKISVYFFIVVVIIIIIFIFYYFSFTELLSQKILRNEMGLLDSDLPFLPSGMGTRQHVCHVIIYN